MREKLENLQNDDGGWPYASGGASWTEPTAFALLALIARGERDSLAVDKGAQWLQTMQAADGGFRPQASVHQSTWVGALVAILPERIISQQGRIANLRWLLEQTGQESSRLYRVRQWMLGNSVSKAGEGWPWFPGAAAWVTPTALTILALQKHTNFSETGEGSEHLLTRRVAEGQDFLTSHACDSGGWNHGAGRALGYQAEAYPETTGLALLALCGVESGVKEAAIREARRFLPICRSAEAYAWLSLGLKANGRDTDKPNRSYEPRTVVDKALLSLADSEQAGIDIWMPQT